MGDTMGVEGSRVDGAAVGGADGPDGGSGIGGPSGGSGAGGPDGVAGPLHVGIARREFFGAMAAMSVPLARVPGDRAIVPAADFPRNDLTRVQAVVGASHANLERVRELVLEQPALAKASWDWGFGDWESALGAASHTGRREIARFLIEHGARPTLFSATMLGELRTVEAFLDADPGLIGLHGPHGISLVRHAQAGGDEARVVLDYLVDRFGPDEAPFGVPGDADAEARYGGAYAFETDPAFRMVVGVRNDLLLVGTGEQPTSRVLPVVDDVFHPTGAPAVRLRFDVRDGRAVALEIQDGPTRVVGVRVEG
jgi:hypothetical protein